MTNNNENKEFHLNVDELFSQIAELMDSSISPLNSQQAYLFLLLLWGYFEVSIVEGTGEDGSGTGTTARAIPNIIQLEKTYQIFDYGSHLKTSPGKYYGSYTTGRLLTTVKAMIALLIKRGAKQLQFDGSAVAKRFAWVECEKNKVKANHYKPDIKAKMLQDRLSRLDSLRSNVYSYSAKK